MILKCKKHGIPCGFHLNGGYSVAVCSVCDGPCDSYIDGLGEYSCSSCGKLGMTKFEALTHGCAGKKPEDKVSEKFENVEKLGLRIWERRDRFGNFIPCVHAADVEKLLSEGVEVRTGDEDPLDNWWARTTPGAFKDTHTGLLINIRPIQPKDTAESLLKILIGAIEHAGIVEYHGVTPPDLGGISAIVKRAKRLIGGGK